MKYTCHGLQNITRLIVGGGGLGNGNTCACIEFFTDEPDGDIWYCEYGRNPTRELVGKSGITYQCDDVDDFKINDPIYSDSDSDSDCETPTSVLDTPFN